MLSSIHPLGERARNNRWFVTAAAFVIASMSGGVAAGMALSAIGLPLRWLGLPDAAVAVVVGVGALMASWLDAGRARIPSGRRQVDERWLTRYRGWVYGAGFGFQLGLGLVTIVTAATVYVVFVLALLSGSLLAGALLGGVFGLVRGITVLTGRGITTPEALRAFHRRLADRSGMARRVAVGADLLVATAAVAVLVLQ